MRNKTLSIFLLLLLVLPMRVAAQVGEHRDDLSIGVNGGYALSNVGFSPKVSQSLHGGITGGLSVRYVCEKYFNTICSIYGEVNYASIGRKRYRQALINLLSTPMDKQRSTPEQSITFRFQSLHTLLGAKSSVVSTSLYKLVHR